MAVQSNGRDDDVVLADVFSRAVRYWWLVTILIITGGIAGWLVSLLQKPLYESTSQITTVIDYAYAGRLTDYEEDHLLSAIGDIITSDGVLNNTAAAAEKDGLVAARDKALAGLTASRQGYRWELNSRFNDPQTAQRLNQIWLAASAEALEQFRQDSITALMQFKAQAEVEACFQQAVHLEPVSPYCTIEEMRRLLAEVEGSAEVSDGNQMLSRLLASRISYQVTREASLPTHPVHYGVNTAVLAGALIGLLAAIILFVMGFPVLAPREK